ncbi:MAG: hypothetical protein WCK77_20925 [Verrucomicrobiota bacterium]
MKKIAAGGLLFIVVACIWFVWRGGHEAKPNGSSTEKRSGVQRLSIAETLPRAGVLAGFGGLNGYTEDDRARYAKTLARKATQAGITNMEYAAKLIEDPANGLEKGRSDLLVIQVLYPETKDRMDLYKLLSSGELKRFHLLRTLATLRREEKIADLEEIHEMLPLGKDRQSAAAALVAAEWGFRGMESSLSLLDSLEMPEERRAALVLLVDDGLITRADTPQEMISKIESLGMSAGELERKWTLLEMVTGHMKPVDFLKYAPPQK